MRDLRPVSVSLCLLLGLPGGLLALNYTEEQRLTLLELPADIRRTKVRTFGSEEMIEEEIRQRLGRRGSRWLYPTSSTQEMAELYRAEVRLTSRLRDLRTQLTAALLEPGQTSHRQTAVLLETSDLPADKHFLEAAGLGVVQVESCIQALLALIGRDPSRLCSDWLDLDVA